MEPDLWLPWHGSKKFTSTISAFYLLGPSGNWAFEVTEMTWDWVLEVILTNIWVFKTVTALLIWTIILKSLNNWITYMHTQLYLKSVSSSVGLSV